MQPDELDALHPVIDASRCIECGLCEKICPNNNIIEFRNPQKVYVAWSQNEEIRQLSASGGVAYELYKYWIKKGGIATGVAYDRNAGCRFYIIEKEEDIKLSQNSKYTFSDTAGIYPIVKKNLNAGVPVLFIGVPCQVAGLYGYLQKEYENLTTVDIICHGMPPASYLQQHIERIEQKKNEYSAELFFRDPKYYTYTYTFTLKNSNGKEFYRKTVLTCDNYQLGYHRALIYRENCYHCHYARKERISDITIGDFSGLGRFAPFTQERRNTSCILQNTSKGHSLLEAIEHNIYMEERPPQEAFDVEKQLKAPSIKHKGRKAFENSYRRNKNFTKASNIALKSEKRRAIYMAYKSKARSIISNILVLLKLRRMPNG